MTPKQRKTKIDEIKRRLEEGGFAKSDRWPNVFYSKDKKSRFKFTQIKLRKEIKVPFGWRRTWSEYVIRVDLDAIPIY